MPDQSTITALYRYPVKGMSADKLEAVTLEPDLGFPLDRAYAIENGGREFDPTSPVYMPKNKFLMLMSHERLALLEAQFDDSSAVLTLLRDGKQVARGNLDQRIGRQLIEQFLSAYMEDELRGPPRLVHAPGHSFSDSSIQVVSLINLASVRELERVMSHPVDPLRFRANIYVDGIKPWEEFDWLGKTLSVASAPLFKVFERIQRCTATNVNPQTATRDMKIPRALHQSFGHADMGVYLHVAAQGKVRVGDTLECT